MRYHGRHRRGWVSGAQQAEAFMADERDRDARELKEIDWQLGVTRPAPSVCVHDALDSVKFPFPSRATVFMRNASGLYRVLGTHEPFQIERWCICWTQREHWHLIDQSFRTLDEAVLRVVRYGEHTTRQLTASGASA